MDIKKALPVYLRIWRAIVIYFIFVGVMALGFLFFKTTQASFAERLYDPALDPDTAIIPSVMQAVMIPLLLGSIMRCFAQRDPFMRDQLYPDGMTVGGFKQNATVVLKSKWFWIEIGTLLLLPVLFPIEFGFRPLIDLMFGGGTLPRAVQKLILCCIVFPLFFAIELWQHTCAIRYWFDMEQSKERDAVRKLAAPLAGIVLLYLLAFFALPFLLALVVSLYYAVRKVGIVLLLAPIVGIVLLIASWRYLRALHIRRKFIGNLRRRCENLGFELSRIKRPYRSVFMHKHECNFTVKANGKLYSCKLLAVVTRGTTMTFSESGIAYILHSLTLRAGRGRHGLSGVDYSSAGLGEHREKRSQLLHFTTHLDYTFAGEGQKILIVNPVPIRLLAGDTNRNRLIDTGDRVGDYKIFTGSAFLNAIERDCVEK